MINNHNVDFQREFIKEFIKIREEKGLSQRQLSVMTGVPQPCIARMESMKVTPQIDTLFKLLQPMGYTLAITTQVNNLI